MTSAARGIVQIEGPFWLAALPRPDLGASAGDDLRMGWVLDLLERQVNEGTGGPFAAAVFSGTTGEVLGAAVNRVEPTAACIAHAEVLALAEAGQQVGSYTLSGHAAVLVSSTEPCAMCLGALTWAGLARVVCGATEDDARAIGFDEGDKPAAWPEALSRRGIAVALGVQRARAVDAMQRYRDTGGLVYNG